MTTASAAKIEQKSSKNTYPPILGAFTPFTPSQGLDFLLSHFSSPVFPRTIMTPKTMVQKEVNSKEQALDYFKESNYEDCRINAFYYSDLKTGGLFWKPDLIFIDLDLQGFKSCKSLRVALDRTLKNIKEWLGDSASPTVLHSGGGYHVIQPVECPALEGIKEFNEYGDKPSEQFLRFYKDFLSNGKADKSHNPSFRSCLLRIPGSINYKRNKQVKILQKWNGIRPRVTKALIIEFQGYLIKKKLNKRLEDEKIWKNRKPNNLFDSNYYEWIEKLLNAPIKDCRKRTIDLVLAPYLIVVKKKEFEKSFKIIREWLDKCNEMEKLDRSVNYNHRIKRALQIAANKQIPPMRREKLIEYLNKK